MGRFCWVNYYVWGAGLCYWNSRADADWAGKGFGRLYCIRVTLKPAAQRGAA